MLAAGAVSAADGERVETASFAGTNGCRCEKRTGTGGRVASNEGSLRAGNADTRVGSTIRIGRACSVARGGTNTCALATLAVVANSPRARNLIFIWVAFGSRRLNGRIRQTTAAPARRCRAGQIGWMAGTVGGPWRLPDTPDRRVRHRPARMPSRRQRCCSIVNRRASQEK
jgi:hypothetical protein